LFLLMIQSDTFFVPEPGLLAKAFAGISSRILSPMDPREDPLWDSRLSQHSESSFFHSSHWARVLSATYGLQPVYCCRVRGDQIVALLPLMEVSNRLSGRRGVSLPFTDLCTPLVSSSGDAEILHQMAMEYGRHRHWRTLDCRGSGSHLPEASKSMAFWGHTIDLQVGPEILFKGLKSTVRCGVRRAERAGLRIEFSKSIESMRAFYVLHCLTRKRLGMPCQPSAFFENIAKFMLDPGCGFIATAWCGDRRVAAAVFFQQGQEAVFKYGASDYSFQHLRPNNLLMWESIKKCSCAGLARLHLGRTSLNHHGLRRFKLGLGASEGRINYFRYDFRKQGFIACRDRAESKLRALLRHMPLGLLKIAGQVLYPHFA
jgi:hypothetical protein